MPSISTPVDIIGLAVRLPGASDEQAFWTLLAEKRCSVSDVAPEGRWHSERFLNPNPASKGTTYTFAGGYIDEFLTFDAAFFGFSPREAAQMDPQQRHVLEVVWEALEDAGIPPSTLAGRNVGVYVGASATDYADIPILDLAAIDSHFMTGNSLSIISNRVSYALDLKGPSLTIDTACSSSMVALAQASHALESGLIELAIVAGVNMLSSPAPYVGFSRAGMLSPTGRSRPFSSEADGYVRAEGAVAVILARPGSGFGFGRTRAELVGVGVNSDGRTNGIALPSMEGQAALMERVYRVSGVDPALLAFVEAHGTGTRAGDPVEAGAIGRVIGCKHQHPVPLGSVKSNIGHLESASGMAGLAKALLSLERRILPATLHLSNINPDIDIERLNIAPNADHVGLSSAGDLYAGLCNYGFGGTNAHAILRRRANASGPPIPLPATRYLVVSCHTKTGLPEARASVADSIRAYGAPVVAAGLAQHRERWPHRTVVDLDQVGDVVSALMADVARGGVVEAEAVAIRARVAFVFSGNGSQWAGMGRHVHGANARFRALYDDVSARLAREGGIDPRLALWGDDVEEKLRSTVIAQPCLFSIQYALAVCLIERGLTPEVVVGHSVGEVAAAAVSGALSLDDAVTLVVERSRHQEFVRGLGRMAVIGAPSTDVEPLLAAVGLGIEIAAENGPNSTTVSGSHEAMDMVARLARRRRLPLVELGIDYPFHNGILEPERDRMIASLSGIRPRKSNIPIVSSVTGDTIDGAALDAGYWWTNIRRTVRFSAALECVLKDAELLIEIGPKPILLGPVADVARKLGRRAVGMATLTQKDVSPDPIDRIVLEAVGRGAWPLEDRGSVKDARAPLPIVRWVRERHAIELTSESFGIYGPRDIETPIHPLLGVRVSPGGVEWRQSLSVEALPFLEGHKVDGSIVLPATAFMEIARAAGTELFGTERLRLDDFDVLRPLVLEPGSARETSVTWSAEDNALTVRSRRRLEGADGFQLHARCCVRPDVDGVVEPVSFDLTGTRAVPEREIYAATARARLEYTGAFRAAVGAHVRTDGSVITDIVPRPVDTGAYPNCLVVDPPSFDAAFHGLFLGIAGVPSRAIGELPIRLARVTLCAPRVPIARSVARHVRSTRDARVFDVDLLAVDGALAARIEGLVMRRVVHDAWREEDRTVVVREIPWAERRSTRDLGLEAIVRDLAVPTSSLAARRAFEALILAIARKSVERFGASDDQAPAMTSDALAAWTTCRDLLDEAIASGASMPADTTILARAERDLADHGPDLRAVSRLADCLPRLFEVGVPIARPADLASLMSSGSVFVRSALAALASAVAAFLRRPRFHRARLLVLDPGCESSLSSILGPAHAGTASITLVTTDVTRAEALVARLEARGQVEVLDPSSLEGRVFDLAIVVATEPIDIGEPSALDILASLGPSAPPLLLAAPAYSPVIDILNAAEPGWFRYSVTPEEPVGLWPLASEIDQGLAKAGFGPTAVKTLVDGSRLMIVAPLAAPLVQSQLQNGVDHDPHRLVPTDLAAFEAVFGPLSQLESDQDVVDIDVDHARPDNERASLVDRMMRLRSVVLAMVDAGRRGPLVVVTKSAGSQGVERAISAFTRCLMNEFPAVDVRSLVIDAAVAPDAARHALHRLLVAGDDDRQGHVRANGLHKPRATRARLSSMRAASRSEAVVLDIGAKGISDLVWRIRPSPAPDAGEVEIEVAVTGLNYRDVMLALGILDDEILGEGLTSGSLGFEFSGRIARVGQGVDGLAVGDRVMGFAHSAFSSRLVMPVGHVFKVPEGMNAETAAAVPVAYVTAWYALVTCARIKSGDVVLIHGGAGGVGLAAISIAHAFGARVVASAGSEEKRAYLRRLGVAYVVDSRSPTFESEVRSLVGGVDIALNSVSGEAMRATLRLVRPFGRFIELGKRDFLDNTRISLRPFVRNLTYHGVDIDQLLAHNMDLVRGLVDDILSAFLDGRISPIPATVIAGEDVAHAFRLMQRSAHIGKIVVTPAKEGIEPVLPRPFVPVKGAHVVLGGTGGFGLATAIWLAEQGARTVIVVSRSGRIDPAHTARVEELRADGIVFDVEALDVSDERALSAALARWRAAHGRVAGVIHSAMVLDDGLIASLEAGRVDAVLAPKVDGFRAIARSVARADLQYLVAYSSSTTIVGSPGQAAYVVGNAFLEGVVEELRDAGVPALAVCWGAISDVGVIARTKGLGQRLKSTTGVSGVTSAEALRYLGSLLADPASAPPVSAYSVIRWVPGAAKLPLMQSSYFTDVFGDTRRSADGTEAIDLMTVPVEQRPKFVSEILRSEVAGVLRMPVSAVETERPLVDLGLDSLMALELRFGIEKRLGIELPVIYLSGGRSIDAIAEAITNNIQADNDAPS